MLGQMEPRALLATVEDPGPGSEPSLTLVLTGGGQVQGAALLEGQEVTVGRGPEVSLRFDLPGLSRVHARFMAVAGAVWVEDLGSRNGTFLEGRRVGRAAVAPGQDITLGPLRGRVERLGEAEGARAAEAPAPAALASPAMQALEAALSRIAASDAPVLVRGETGVGKERVTASLHERGPRRGGPFVALNCATIPRGLVETTLFGHERGAFTGAAERSAGVFEGAHGGTLFLDEVAELPLEAQAALLRVLESGRLRRVGGSRELAVDVRLVAATHRDLEALVAQGAFRQDLYYRLSVLVLRVPPLRERPEDLEPLAQHLLQEALAHRGLPPRRWSAAALAALAAYGWPGNVRELRNAVEHAVVWGQGPELTVMDLPEALRGEDAGQPAAGVAGLGAGLRPAMRRFEAGVLAAAEAHAGGRRADMAALLGVPLRTLMRRLAARGAEAPDADALRAGAEALASLRAAGLALPDLMAAHEAALIQAAMDACDGHRGAAARRLGIPVRTLGHKLAGG
jgi:two-component system response regulator AtoC